VANGRPSGSGTPAGGATPGGQSDDVLSGLVR
jgi:hypothetical protein